MEYTLHIDDGHAWLEVLRSELVEHGVEDKISKYSYQKEDKVFLEEDCDMAIFCRAKAPDVNNLSFNEIYHGNTAPVRYMEKYTN